MEPESGNNKEIFEALKEFEQKQGGVTTPQSTEVVDAFSSQSISASIPDTETSSMVSLVIKYSGGMIKDQRQAEYALLALVIIMLAFSLYFFFGAGAGTAPTVIPPAQTGLR